MHFVTRVAYDARLSRGALASRRPTPLLARGIRRYSVSLSEGERCIATIAERIRAGYPRRAAGLFNSAPVDKVESRDRLVRSIASLYTFLEDSMRVFLFFFFFFKTTVLNYSLEYLREYEGFGAAARRRRVVLYICIYFLITYQFSTLFLNNTQTQRAYF